MHQSNCPYGFLKLRVMITHNWKVFMLGVLNAAVIISLAGCGPKIIIQESTNGAIDVNSGTNYNPDTSGAVDVDDWQQYSSVPSELWDADAEWEEYGEFYEELEYNRPDLSFLYPFEVYYQDWGEMTPERYLYRLGCYENAHNRGWDIALLPGYVYTEIMRSYYNLTGIPFYASLEITSVYYGADNTTAMGALSTNGDYEFALYFSKPAGIAKGDHLDVYGLLEQGSYMLDGYEIQCPMIEVYDFGPAQIYGLAWIDIPTYTQPIDLASKIPDWVYQTYLDGVSYYRDDGEVYTVDGQPINGEEFDVYGFNFDPDKTFLFLKVRFHNGTYDTNYHTRSFTNINFSYGRLSSYDSAENHVNPNLMPKLGDIKNAYMHLLPWAGPDT